MPRKTHGASRAMPEYRVWSGMLRRCNKPNDASYRHYGGRGIRVCQRWQGEKGFAFFFLDMGQRPSPKHQIDRINNDGNYEPGNCRWATKREQALNRRTNRYITARGKTQCVTDWANERGFDSKTLRNRLDKMSVDDALFGERIPRAPMNFISCRGERLTVTDWSVMLGISRSSVRRRVARGLNPDGTPRAA